MASGVVVRAPSLVVLACNAAAERLLGLRVEQLDGAAPVGDDWHAIDEHGAPLPCSQDGYPVALRDTSASNVVIGIHKRDGSVTWLLMSCVPVADVGSEEPIAYVWTFTDLSASRSDERYRAILEATLEGVWVLQLDGTTSFANRRMAELLGTTPEALSSASIWDFASDAQDRKCVEELLANTSARSGQPCDFRLRRADGTHFWASITIAPLAGGEWGKSLATVRDVSAARALEAEMRAHKEHLVTALEVGQVGTWEIDLATGKNKACPVLRKIFGIAEAEPFDSIDAVMNRIHPDDREWLDAHRANYVAQGAKQRDTLTFRIVRPDGEVRWVRSCGQAITTADNQRHLIGALVDITETRALEEQLEQARPLEALGRLAGGVAHDFNNLSTAILAALSYVEAAKVDAIRADVAIIRTATERGAELTRQLLAFARKQVIELTSLDLNAIVLELTNVLARLVGEDITLTIDPEPELWAMRGGESQLEQVVINLVVNGREAMPKGGQLRIETRNLINSAATMHEHRGIPEGEYVYLAVTDSGTGIDEKVLPHIFEPFYTTRRAGTGLGLASTYGIVRQLGGYIRVRTEADIGSTFLVYFPREREPVQPDEPMLDAPDQPMGATATVMFVEDDDLVRRVISRGLADAGYQVLVAGDAEQALAMAEQHEGPIDVLIADVVMPGISGCQLAGKLAAQRPATKVLFVSGYTNQIIARYGALEPGQNFLAKPYTIDVLRDRVDELLYSE